MKTRSKDRLVLYFVVSLIGFVSTEAYAQETRYLDKVTLNNRSVIWGVAEFSEGSVTVFFTDEDSVSFPLAMVKAVETDRFNPNLYLDRTTGTYYQLTLAMMLGKGHHDSENIGSFSSSVISGYKFMRALGVGIGVGLNYYEDQRHLPLYLDIQGDLLDTRVTPYYQLSMGWSWADGRNTVSQDAKVEGGLYLSPSIGIRWHLAKYSWHLKLSYVRQESTTRFEPIDFGNGNMLTNVENRTLQRVGLGLGVTF